MVRSLARIGCTHQEIATIVGISQATLRRRAKDEIAKGYDEMRMSLRRWQYEKAKSGNVAMLIWLGKQYLGQTDRNEETHKAEIIEIERIAPKLLE
jgi:DNA-binding MurR/RpiR family transcriptional regulator